MVDAGSLPERWGGEYDLTTMQTAESMWGVQTGINGLMVHPKKVCEGRDIPCCIHSPSTHHMATWPMNWRGDTGVMERTCPHGTGHPDPDHMAYVLSLTPAHTCQRERCLYPHLEWHGSHGCDGCCAPVQHEQQST